MTMAMIGGGLIGLSAVWLYLSLGRVAGISGIATNALLRVRDNTWPTLFLLGLGIGGWIAYAVVGPRPAIVLDGKESLLLLVAGVLVGFGTRMGSGCTSGHGVCGMARLSRRSLLATVCFLMVGMATATLLGAL